MQVPRYETLTLKLAYQQTFSCSYQSSATVTRSHAVVLWSLLNLQAGRSLAIRPEGWPEDWLNDSVKGFLSAKQELQLQATYPSPEQPGLRVYVPTPEYMLAMKCMAMRPEGVEGAQDIEDIRHLIRITNLKTTTEILELVENFYPRALIPPKVAFGIEEIMEKLSEDAENEAKEQSKPTS